MTRVIPFHKEHIKPIKDKEKRLTIRHDYDHTIRQWDKLKFVDTDNLIFGTARVMDIYTMTVKDVVNTDWEYHYSYRDMADFRMRFNAFYPDAEFEPETELTVIEWNRTFTPNWEYF